MSKPSDVGILILCTLPSQSHCSPWCEWAFSFAQIKFLSWNSNVIEVILCSSQLCYLSHKQHRHLDVCSCLGSIHDVAPWGVLHLSSFVWVYSGFLSTWSVPHKNLSLLFFPHTGLKLPVTKDCGGERNSDEGKIRLGAQCRWTVLGSACDLVYYVLCL